MLLRNRQHLILMIGFAGISSCSFDKALSRPDDPRLQSMDRGSQSKSAYYIADGGESSALPKVEHGRGIITEQKSNVLDLEERLKPESSSQPAEPESSRSMTDDRATTQTSSPESEPKRADEAAADTINTMQSKPATEQQPAEPSQAEQQQAEEQQAEQQQTGQQRGRRQAERSEGEIKHKKNRRSLPAKKKHAASDEAGYESPHLDRRLENGNPGQTAGGESNQAQAGKTQGQEEIVLSKLVKELQFGSLKNSIALLNQLVREHPDDPDYNALLGQALQLRDSDVWYDYQRRTREEKRERSKEEQKQPEIMKPVANPNVNALKRESWFLIRSVNKSR